MTVTEAAEKPNQEWIESMLSQPGFVRWDRFTEGVVDGDLRIDVYGWINRPKDDYMDFVLLTLWPESEDFAFTTSSARYSDALYQLWTGDDPDSDHNHCKRVQEAFDVSNAIISE